MAGRPKIEVPKGSGPEIVLTTGGEVVHTFKVSDDDTVTPKDDDERDLILSAVPGAKLVS